KICFVGHDCHQSVPFLSSIEDSYFKVWEHSTTFPTKADSSGEEGRIGKNADRSDGVSQNQANLA
ncbi:MAG: hypothetical protein OXC62_09255, partial [Aestuariivita sp.]|nr:hypothetical protein [Aestuariivita sp.]